MELSLEVGREGRRGAEVGGAGTDVELPLIVECLISARTADAVFVVDPGHRIVHWDDRAESLTGLLGEETVGRPCHRVLRGECENAGRLCAKECPVMDLARAGRAVPSFDARIETRNSGRRWVNVSVLVVETEEGPYLVHLMRDAQKAHEALEMARGLIRLSRAGGNVNAPERRDVPELTPRQTEVLAMLAEGMSVNEICRQLFLSKATVRNHVRALLQALGAHTQLEAVARARRFDLLPA